MKNLHLFGTFHFSITTMGDEVAYPEEYDEAPKMPQDRAEKVFKLIITITI